MTSYQCTDLASELCLSSLQQLHRVVRRFGAGARVRAAASTGPIDVVGFVAFGFVGCASERVDERFRGGVCVDGGGGAGEEFEVEP